MKIIAHRGNDGIYKANSLKGILHSLSLSYIDGVEFDIRMTYDFKFVINHDPFYKGYLIKNTGLKKLQKYKIDTLEDVLRKVDNKKILLIEIKEESDKFKILCAKLYRILRKYDLNYYIFSFNYNLMKYFMKKYPDIKSGLLVGIKKNLNKINSDFDFIAINYIHTNTLINKETFVWTINTLKEFNLVKPYQNIITDKPKYFYDLSIK